MYTYKCHRGLNQKFEVDYMTIKKAKGAFKSGLKAGQKFMVKNSANLFLFNSYASNMRTEIDGHYFVFDDKQKTIRWV